MNGKKKKYTKKTQENYFQRLSSFGGKKNEKERKILQETISVYCT